MNQAALIQDTHTERPEFTRGAVNLLSARLGARAVFATDQFFAPLERMLKDDPAIFLPGEYDENGKWMDGWESRRKRVPGHDYAVLRLAMPGRIAGFDVDTSFFTGNYPPQCSIDASCMEDPGADPDPSDDALWTEILPRTDLSPSRHHFFELSGADHEKVWTHLRLHIYPDGGIARLRAYGTAHFDWSAVGPREEIDLAYVFHGGRALAWSDAHYGAPERMLAPGRGVNMGDGWETARRRGPGHDWAILKLGHPGEIGRVVVDTAHFKGNYPDTVELRGAFLPDAPADLPASLLEAAGNWSLILPRAKLQMDHIHEFMPEAIGPVTHVRIGIFPDGGVSRLRLFGTKA